MSLYFETLQYVDADNATQEIALRLANLAGYGAVKCVFNPRSHAPGTFQITWAVAPETGIAIPFKSRCIVYAGRTSADGSPNSFSGGTILFQGRRTDNAGSASAKHISTALTLSDAWWDLERITLQAAWYEITGGTWGSPTYTPFYWPDCVLFQASPGVTYSPAAVQETISTWQMIKEIIGYAADYATGADAVDLQLTASAEFTPAYCNWFPMRTAKCAAALAVCLRPHPGVFTGFDYTTTPPTLHFRDRAHMTAVTLPYKATDDAGIIHIASDVEPLESLVPDALRLYYQITGTFNGNPVLSYETDIYPVDAGNSLLCLDYSIDITGPAQQEVSKNFTSAAFDATDLDLWRYKIPSLKQVSQGGQIPNDGAGGALLLVDSSPYDAVAHPKGIQVTDENGDPVDLSTYTYWTDEAIFAWFKLTGGSSPAVKKVTVKGYFHYSRTTTLGGTGVTDVHAEHEHSMRLVLTNAPTGTYVLKQTTNPGEAIPSGLAQSLYNELSVLQWNLRHEIIQWGATADAVPTLIQPGLQCVNLAGGKVAWETMNAVPQEVSIEFFRTAAGLLVARHTISCGPVNHLEPGYIVQLTNLFWNRHKSGIDANRRLSGNVSSNTTDLSVSADAKENATDANPVPITTNNVFVDSGAIAGQTIQDAAGVAAVLAAATPTPIVSAADMRVQKPREMAACDTVGNTFFVVAQVTGGYTKG